MTRRFLDDVRAESAVLLVTGGETTGPELNSVIQDVIDSTVQDECAIQSTTTTNNVPVTNTWTKVNTTVYGQNQGGDGVFLIPDFQQGEIMSSATPGFTYVAAATVSFIGENNDRYDFTITQNGVPVGTVVSVTGQGNGDPVFANPRVYINSAGVSDEFALAVQYQDPSGTIDIESCELSLVVYPTNNP